MSKISFRAAESLGRFLGVCSFRILHQVVRVQMAWHRQRCVKHRDLGVGWLAHRLSEGIQTCTYCVRHGDLGTFVYLSALGCTLTVCVILNIYLINHFFFFLIFLDMCSVGPGCDKGKGSCVCVAQWRKGRRTSNFFENQL